MKSIKSVCLVAAMLVSSVVLAQEPPEAINICYDDGRVYSTLLDMLDRMVISPNDMIVVCRNRPDTTISFESVNKITFGDNVVDMYSVSFAVSGGSGTLSAMVVSGDGIRSIVSGESVPDGAEVIFTAVPSENYRVKGWHFDGDYTEDGANIISVTVSGGPVSVSVEFEEDNVVDVYSVSFAVSGGSGTLSATVVSGDGIRSIVSGESVPDGAEVIFTAVPSENYRVKGWHFDGDYTEAGANSISVTVSGMPVSVSVEFEEDYTGVSNITSDGIIVYVREHDAIVIESQYCDIVQVKIINAEGRLIRNECCKVRVLTMSTVEMVPGVYVLDIHTKKGCKTGKVVIK
ncbi:MAG: hypothetical protein ACI3Z7_03135 [Candidatus Aphodosoma sp.]